MSNFDNIIKKFSDFILHVTEIIGENEIVDNVNKLSEIEKIEIIKKFNDFITPNNFNHFLSQLADCKDLFESDAKFEYDKEDYTTVFIKLKKHLLTNQ